MLWITNGFRDRIAFIWYLLGHAVDDSKKRLYAFQQVLKLDPNHLAAQKQAARLLAPPAVVAA